MGAAHAVEGNPALLGQAPLPRPLTLDLRNPPQWRRPRAEHYAHSLELCVEAERLGIDSVWCSEHHGFEDGYLPQTLTFLAAVAARTSRVRLATALVLAPLRQPVQIAEEVAIVDILSGGRLELGVGAGYRIPEFAAYGQDFAGRFARNEACVVEVRRLWREGGVTPGPLQDPLPIWMGGFLAQGARRAGRQGAGLLSLDPGLISAYTQALAEAGHDPATARMAGHLNWVLADDPDAAWPRLRDHVAYQWDTYRAYGVEGTDLPKPEPIDPDEWRTSVGGAPPRFEVLTPEDAAERLRTRFTGTPVVEVYCWASVAGMPDDLVERHVELMSAHLRPLVADL